MNQRKTYTVSPLQPPRERGTGRAFLLAALMHVLLVAMLYHGINWQNSTPTGPEAELWTEVPDAPPAPRSVSPPAQDDDAEIALQPKHRQQHEVVARETRLAEHYSQQALKARQQKAEVRRAAQLIAQQQIAEKQKQADKLRHQQLAQQKKLEQQRKQAQVEAQKRAAESEKAAAAAKAKATAAANAKLDKERQARLVQLQGSAGAGQSRRDGLTKRDLGSGSGGNATLPRYADKVKRRVRPFIVWNGTPAGLMTRLQVRCAPSGNVLGVSVVKPSGNAAWDETVVGAVRSASPLPPDTNGSTPANIVIIFRAAE
ncbi:MAG: cell envelope integrity protein TolA [Burkholderia sp.]|nr:MAG: hypothetical protein E5299_00898 [Burkholderia gladioli]